MDNLRQSGEKGVRSSLRSSKSVHAPGAHSFNALYNTSALRLLSRFTTCLTRTTTGLRLLFASTRLFVPRKCKKLEDFDFDFDFTHIVSMCY